MNYFRNSSQSFSEILRNSFRQHFKNPWILPGVPLPDCFKKVSISFTNFLRIQGVHSDIFRGIQAWIPGRKTSRDHFKKFSIHSITHCHITGNFPRNSFLKIFKVFFNNSSKNYLIKSKNFLWICFSLGLQQKFSYKFLHDFFQKPSNNSSAHFFW